MLPGHMNFLTTIYKNIPDHLRRGTIGREKTDLQARLQILDPLEQSELLQAIKGRILELSHTDSAQAAPMFGSTPKGLAELLGSDDLAEITALVDNHLDHYFERYSPIELAEYLYRFPVLRELLRPIEEKRAPRPILIPEHVERLAQRLKLDDTAKLLVACAAFGYQNYDSMDHFAYVNAFSATHIGHCLRFYELSTGLSSTEVLRLTKPGTRLGDLHIFTYARNRLSIMGAFYRYFVCEDDVEIEGTLSDLTNLPTLESFLINPTHKELALGFLKAPGPCNLLFHGDPGTGKSTLARVLAREAGLEAWHLDAPADLEETENARETLLAVSLDVHGRRETVLIVDEADNLVMTERDLSFFRSDSSKDRKAWLNRILETHSAKVIFICNKLKSSDSTLRRFHLILNFNAASALQRRLYWEGLVADQQIDWLTHDDVRDLSERYRLSIGVVAQALKSVQTLKPADQKGALEELLRLHHRAVSEEPIAVRNQPRFYPEFVKSSASLEELTTKAQAMVGKGKGRLSYLLTGPSGTGKTAFARHVAREAGLELMALSYAELTSAYVGETEKRLVRAFLEAEQQGKALFIDEIDSFVQDRRHSQKTWEVTGVNQFLTCLENFQGLFLAATNLVERLDPAIMRRFTDRVEFKPCDLEQRIKMVQTLLAPVLQELPDTDQLAQDLGDLKIAPGDLAALRQSYEFTPVSWGELLKRLKDTRKTRPIALH